MNLPLPFVAVMALIPGGISGPMQQRTTQAQQSPKPLPQTVLFELQLTRRDSVAPAADASAPATVLAAPKLITLDRNTASVSLSGTDMSYNVSLSPTVETANNSVQVLWNLRLSGKSLTGASTVNLSGAGRLTVGKEGSLTEITLTDGPSGKRTTFVLRAKATVGAIEDPAPPETKP